MMSGGRILYHLRLAMAWIADRQTIWRKETASLRRVSAVFAGVVSMGTTVSVLAGDDLAPVTEEMALLTNDRVIAPLRHIVSIADSPSSVSVLTDEGIRHSGATDHPTLLRRILGLDVMQTVGADFHVHPPVGQDRFVVGQRSSASRLLNNDLDTLNRWDSRMPWTRTETLPGCSTRPSSAAAASEGANRRLSRTLSLFT